MNLFSLKMNFNQATRYLLIPLKYSGVIPFKTLGLPEHQSAPIDKKCLYLNTTLLLYLFFYWLYTCFKNDLSTLFRLLIFFNSFLFAIMIFTSTLTARYYQQQIFEILKEMIQFSVDYPKSLKYFSWISILCKVKFGLILLTMILDVFYYFPLNELKTFGGVRHYQIYHYMTFIATEFYVFLFISIVQLFLTVVVVSLRGLNDELLISVQNLHAFNKLFTLYDKINYIFEIQLIVIITMVFSWCEMAMFEMLTHYLENSDIFFETILLNLITFFNLIHYVVVLGFLGQNLQKEVRKYLYIYTYKTLIFRIR